MNRLKCDECGEESAGTMRDGTSLCMDCALEQSIDLEDLLDMTLRCEPRRVRRPIEREEQT